MIITQHAIVMVFGAFVASAGLVLLFSRKELAENRIRLFGQEFQISTPALVVFLAGCGIFILPLVLPIKNDSFLTIPLPWHRETGIDPTPSPMIGTGEKEPNDQFTAANVIAVGTTINAAVATGQDRDFYKFKTSGRGSNTPGQARSNIRIILRKTSVRGFDAMVTVYTDVEEKTAGDFAFSDEPVSFAFEAAPESFYYIMVKGYSPSSQGNYELVVRVE